MGKIIQIVEDDEDIRFILEFILTDSGFNLETFDSIQAFSRRERKEGVVLIILDVMLPDGSGIDLCKQLKNSEPISNIPVIIMSAHASSEIAMEEGKANMFIAKPFDVDDFVAKVNRCCSY